MVAGDIRDRRGSSLLTLTVKGAIKHPQKYRDMAELIFIDCSQTES